MWTSPQLGVFRQELQFLSHHVPDLAVGESSLSFDDHRVLVVHLECVGHGDSELHVLRRDEAVGTHERLSFPLCNTLAHSTWAMQQGEASR